MKKYTVKEKLVQYMMENGNDFTYTEMIRALFKIKFGPNFEYDWKQHRGYYATNFGDLGYMSNGGGTCGVHKKENGKWEARVYTKDEIVRRKISRNLKNLVEEFRVMSRQYQLALEYGNTHFPIKDQYDLKQWTDSKIKRYTNKVINIK